MGKNLEVLIHEASKNGEYFFMDVIKKVAKHMLLALKSLHECEINGSKIIHSDIKPQNILVCTSQRNIHDQLKKIVNSRESLKPFRMTNRRECISPFTDEENIRARLKECVNNVPKKEKFSGLTFKLIDFGNVMEEGRHRSTGAFGYRPPEYYFKAPLSYSHDIWSLGIVLVHMITCQRFITIPKALFFIVRTERTEMNEMKNMTLMFGKLPRELYTNANFPYKFKKSFTEDGLNHDDVKMRFRNALQEKIEIYPMYYKMCADDRQELLDFLSNMIDFNPKRKTAAELLTLPLLNDVI